MSVTGDALREARMELGWTQQQLAEEVGCTQSQIADWERGAREPQAANVRRLCSALDITADTLLGVGR